MASVNTSSIREEITHVKAQFDEQVRSGKVADETHVLISSLLVIVDLLIAIFLEKSTKKGNKNSSIPSSQTDEDNSSKPRKKPTSRAEHEEAFANKSHAGISRSIARVPMPILRRESASGAGRGS